MGWLTLIKLRHISDVYRGWHFSYHSSLEINANISFTGEMLWNHHHSKTEELYLIFHAYFWSRLLMAFFTYVHVNNVPQKTFNSDKFRMRTDVSIAQNIWFYRNVDSISVEGFPWQLMYKNEFRNFSHFYKHTFGT